MDLNLCVKNYFELRLLVETTLRTQRLSGKYYSTLNLIVFSEEFPKISEDLINKV